MPVSPLPLPLLPVSNEPSLMEVARLKAPLIALVSRFSVSFWAAFCAARRAFRLAPCAGVTVSGPFLDVSSCGGEEPGALPGVEKLEGGGEGFDSLSLLLFPSESDTSSTFFCAHTHSIHRSL